MKQRGLSHRGFTLIELLFTMTILVALVGTFSYGLMHGWRMADKASKRMSDLQIGQMVLVKIVEDVRIAREVMITSGEEELVLDHYPEVIRYGLKSGKVRYLKDAYTRYLTEVGEVKSLTFSYPAEGFVKVKLETDQKALEVKVGIRNG